MNLDSKRFVLAEARRLGADVEDRSARGELDLNLWLPAGTRWVATGGHSLSIHYHSDPGSGWADLLADVKMGTEPCDDPDCETCHP